MNVAKETVAVDDRRILVPADLDRALGTPRLVRIEERPDGELTLRATTAVDLAYRRVRGLLRRRVRGAPATRFHAGRRIAAKGEAIVFTARRALPAGGPYGIVSRGSHVQLVPFEGKTEEEAAEGAWRHAEAYHEHLPPAAQQETAKKRSEWLVESVLEPLDATSFLEIGCGAGRNLLWLSQRIPSASLAGFDVHEEAIDRARAALAGSGADLRHGSAAELLPTFDDNSIDVVFSFGVLMHITGAEVPDTLREMHRIARRAVVAFELHGPSHSFDFWRYPRDYGELARSIGLSGSIEYTVLPKGGFLGGPDHDHSLLVVRK